MVKLQSIQEFFNQKHLAIAGVSRKKGKFGNTIYSELSKRGYSLYPLHPVLDEYEGLKCYKNISSLPDEVTGLVISTKDDQTRKLVMEAGEKGIGHIWLQQGSASKETLKEAWMQKENIIAGHCILMFAEPVHGIHGFHRWLKKNFGKYPN